MCVIKKTIAYFNEHLEYQHLKITFPGSDNTTDVMEMYFIYLKLYRLYQRVCPHGALAQLCQNCKMW